MRREARKYLHDIAGAIGRLKEFTDGKSFDDYRRDAMRRAAVERQFEIIGEAMAQLAKADADLAERISGYQRIIAFRNLLIHAYDAARFEAVAGNVRRRYLSILGDLYDRLAGEALGS